MVPVHPCRLWISRIVRLPALRLKRNKDCRHRSPHIQKQRSILPNTVITAMVVRRIPLVHMDVVNAIHHATIRKRAPKRIHRCGTICNRFIQQLHHSILKRMCFDRTNGIFGQQRHLCSRDHGPPRNLPPYKIQRQAARLTHKSRHSLH